MLTREQFDELRAKGLTVDQIVKFEGGFTPKKRASGWQEAKEDFSQMGNSLKNTFSDTKDKIQGIADSEMSGEQGKLRSFGQAFGAVAGGVSKGVGDVFTGAVKAVLPQSGEDKVKQAATSVFSKAREANEAVGDPFGKIVQKYNSLDDKTKRDVDGLLGISSLAGDLLGARVGKSLANAGVKQTGRAVDAAKEGIVSAGKSVIDKASTPIAATTQKGQELLERVPRAASRFKEGAVEAAEKRATIKSSSPKVAQAIKAVVDDVVIDVVSKADPATKKAYKQVIDIAEESKKTIGVKKQPSIVGGELAAKQFDIINKKKKDVGAALGEKIKSLSKTEAVDMNDAFYKLDNILSSQGVDVVPSLKGVKLDFTNSNFTPAERAKIEELYNLAGEGGVSMSPSKIHGKDQLFSKLSREANMEGVGKIMVETEDGAKSLFGVFREVFSKKLEDLSPEIKDLNRQYRSLSMFVDDLEDSIFKTPNLNITKSADQAEFAKVNMRRIFGEAQSSPAFEAVADEMDRLARVLGYNEANPKDVAAFAEEIRKLYPNTIPKAGFQGGIVTGVRGALTNMAEKVLSAGTPNEKDKIEALIKLLSD